MATAMFSTDSRRWWGPTAPVSARAGAADASAREVGHLGGVLAHLGAGRREGLDPGLGGAARARDDRPRMAHLLARWGGDARDVGHHRLVHLGLDVVGRPLLLGAA